MVLLPHEPPRGDDCALRGDQEAVRPDAQADARGQVCGALQGGGGRERCEELGSCAEVHGGGEAAGLCGIHVVG